MAPFQWPAKRPWSGLCLAGLGGLSGLLFWLSIPKFDLQFLAWLCLLPSFLALLSAPPRHFATIGLAFGLIACSGRTHWIAETLQLYGNLSLVQAVGSNILLIFYMALYPAAYFWICGRLRSNSALFPWIAASLWVLMEWVQTWLFTGFPWYLLGNSQYLNLPLLQLASITGVYGISFLLVLANTTLVQIAFYRQPARYIALPLLVVLAALFFGHYRLASFPVPIQSEALNIGIVQGNIPQDKKWKVNRKTWTTQHYDSLARSLAGADPDLIVFPETALPYRFNNAANAELQRQILDLGRTLGMPLLVGSLQSVYEAGVESLYNRAFLIDSNGRIDSWSDKVHLVPFGEYLPLPFFFQYLEGLVEESGIFVPGEYHKVLALPDGNARFGVFICYESIFPAIPRTLAQQGATFLINTTNDAWFGRTAAPHQHFATAVLRAVETGLPILRAANTGISGLIAPTGEIVAQTELFETTAITVQLHPRQTTTPYVRYGDLFLVVCALFLAGIAMLKPYWAGRS